MGTGDRPLADRVALVTGGSRGIGRAIAMRLARDGALVVVHYATNADAAAETVDRIVADGGAAFAVGQPLGVEGDVDGLFARVDEQLEARRGTTRLDVVVNNAAVSLSSALAELTLAEYEEQFAVNARAPLFIAQAAAARMGHGGTIISVSSGLVRQASAEWLTYTMAKAALEAMTMVLAKDLGPRGISVNAVSPGLIDTEMNGDLLRTDDGQAMAAALSPYGRVGLAEDVADVVRFLSSHDSRWVTGQVIDASGGALL